MVKQIGDGVGEGGLGGAVVYGKRGEGRRGQFGKECHKSFAKRKPSKLVV